MPRGLAALLLSPLVATAQPSEIDPPALSLSLERAQQLAASRSPALSAARREVDAASGGVRQARAWRNPELNVSVEDTRAATRTTTATIGFPWELGGKRPARINAAERARELAGAQLAESRAQVRAQVVLAYATVVVAQQRVQLAGDSARLAAQAAGAISQRVEAGKVSPVAATRATVDAANAQLEVAEARAALQGARLVLGALWGDTEPTFGEVDEDLGATPTRPPLGELLREVDGSPALQADRLQIESRQALIDVERSKGMPDLLVNVGARRDNELGLTQAVVGISMPLPLFDRNQGAVHEASRRADKARDDYAAARLRLVSELSQAAIQLATAQASLTTLRDAVLPAAQQAYDASTTGFEAGKFGVLEVIDAQRALLQARARTLNTLATAWQAATTIDRLLGR